MGISIHALLAESDRQVRPYRLAAGGFQSTLSLRRATGVDGRCIVGHVISIHALLAESDCCSKAPTAIQIQFQSTLSLRRATPAGGVCPRLYFISIHALLAESDGWVALRSTL